MCKKIQKTVDVVTDLIVFFPREKAFVRVCYTEEKPLCITVQMLLYSDGTLTEEETKEVCLEKDFCDWYTTEDRLIDFGAVTAFGFTDRHYTIIDIAYETFEKTFDEV